MQGLIFLAGMYLNRGAATNPVTGAVGFQYAIGDFRNTRMCDQLLWSVGQRQDTAETRCLVAIKVIPEFVSLGVEVRTQFAGNLIDQIVRYLISDDDTAVRRKRLNYRF